MNVFNFSNEPVSEKQITSLMKSPHVRIERIICASESTDWIEREETEFAILLEGSVKIAFVGARVVTMKKGDTLLVESNQKHRVCPMSADTPCVFLCIFYDA